MWNYLTYRDAIGIVGLDPAELYPGGTTRLDPATWADLGWLTCFAGPPAQRGRGDARRGHAPSTSTSTAPTSSSRCATRRRGVLGRARDDDFEVVGTEGAQAGIALSLHGRRRPGRRGHPRRTPATSTCPSAVIADRRRARHGADRRRATATASTPTSWPRRSPRARARSSSSIRSTRTAPCRPRTSSPRWRALADEHGLLLIHDVTHGLARHRPRRAVRVAAGARADRATRSPRSRSRTASGWPARGSASSPGRRGLMRSCLRLKAALTRLNTSLIAQHGALAALRDAALPRARRRASCARNLAHLEQTLAGIDGLALDDRRPCAGWPARSTRRGAGVDVAGADGRAVRAPRRRLPRRRAGRRPARRRRCG